MGRERTNEPGSKRAQADEKPTPLLLSWRCLFGAGEAMELGLEGLPPEEEAWPTGLAGVMDADEARQMRWRRVSRRCWSMLRCWSGC